jgi:hypothetical protein
VAAWVSVTGPVIQPWVSGYRPVSLATGRPLALGYIRLCLAAVLVPDLPGLRLPPLVLEHLQVRCAREAGAPLLPAPPVLTPESSAGSAPRPVRGTLSKSAMTGR